MEILKIQILGAILEPPDRQHRTYKVRPFLLREVRGRSQTTFTRGQKNKLFVNFYIIENVNGGG